MKSRDYNEAIMAQFTQRLNAIAYSMSFKLNVELEVISLLAKWISEQFGDVSMQEVALAFDLVTANKLPMKPRHYDRFDKQYIGDVLHAFKTFRNIQMKLFKEDQAMKQLTEKIKKVGATGKEMYTGLKKIAVEKGEIMIVADWNAAFKYAQDEGLIRRMNNIEKKIYKKKVEATIKREREGNKLSDILSNAASLVTECRKRMLIDHLKKLIDDSKVSQKGI